MMDSILFWAAIKTKTNHYWSWELQIFWFLLQMFWIAKNIFKKIDSDNDELLDVLSSYKCYSIPKEDNIEEIVLQLAHKELIQKPKYIASCFNSVFTSVKFPKSFLFNLKETYLEKLVTERKIVSLFSTEENASAQELLCIEHLKTYAKNLTREKLEIFLRLGTGADVISVEKIDINFVNITGFKRSPEFRTCGPILFLPNSTKVKMNWPKNLTMWLKTVS